MKRPILVIFIICLVIFNACQNDVDREHGESMTDKSPIKGHYFELQSDKNKPEGNWDLKGHKGNEEKFVYLTFDDGPTAATTDILDTLHEFDAKATFFMLEPSMRNLPKVVHRIVEEDHAVGLHGVTHNRNQFYKSEQAALKEMNTTQKTLKQITGIESNLIRTPYGSIPYLTESFREVLDSNGF